MDFGRALSLSLKIGSGRKLEPGDLEESQQIGWGYAAIGLILLIVVQTILIAISGLDARYLVSVLVVLFVTLGGPYLVYILTASGTNQQVRLPASLFYLGIALAFLQLISLVANSVSIGSTFLLVMTIALVTSGARGFFQLKVVGTIFVGIVVAAILIGAGAMIMGMLR